MKSVFEQDDLKIVELAPCPFCGGDTLKSYTTAALEGVVACKCGASITIPMPSNAKDKDGRACLSESQIQTLEQFRKRHRLKDSLAAIGLWARCLAVDAWNQRAKNSPDIF
jgi:hypothetical protein